MKIIAGAGGHALEIYDILISSTLENIFFFDDTNLHKKFLRECRILHSLESLSESGELITFYLGVGNPKHRNIMFQKFNSVKGKLRGIRGASSISLYSTCEDADILDNCYIGPDVKLSRGCLINTGAQIHHSSSIGEFCEISPRAVILGNVKIGNQSSIGANSTVLPGIKIGSHVVIGAGSVVTKDIPDNVTAYGNPARIK